MKPKRDYQAELHCARKEYCAALGKYTTITDSLVKIATARGASNGKWSKGLIAEANHLFVCKLILDQAKYELDKSAKAYVRWQKCQNQREAK